MMPKPLRNFIWLAGLLGAVLAPIYLRQKREALRRLRAIGQVIQTSAGPLEYAVTGKGYPVVVLHGMAGGSEQGLLMTHLLDANHYQIIAPTRPGYRRTPLTTGASFEQQADAIAELLDALHIPTAAVLGISGGGFAAMQFAMRYPDRCKGLVLLSAHGPATLDFLPNRKLLWVFEGMVLADFLLWLALRLPIKMMLLMEGSRPQQLDDPQTLRMGQHFMAGAFPAADWKHGTRNDIEQLFALEEKPEWPLEQIKVPTLVLHGKRDRIVRFASAALHAERIPNARLIPFEEGTHFSFLTYHTEMSHALAEFLK